MTIRLLSILLIAGLASPVFAQMDKKDQFFEVTLQNTDRTSKTVLRHGAVLTTGTAYTKTQTDARYLKLDASNSPVTGKPIFSGGGVFTKAAGDEEGLAGAPFAVNAASNETAGDLLVWVGVDDTMKVGINASGHIEAVNFTGPLTGNVTGNLTGTASNADQLDSHDSTYFAAAGDLPSYLIKSSADAETAIVRNKSYVSDTYSFDYQIADTTLSLKNDGLLTYPAPGTGITTTQSTRVSLLIDGKLGANGGQPHGIGSVALGIRSEAWGNGSIAMGVDAISSNSGIAIGNTAVSGGGVAVGFSTNASNNGTALGYEAEATGQYGFAGPTCSATNVNATAIGLSCLASGRYSTALGLGSKAIGYAAQVISDMSTATALTAGIIGGGHNRILNKGADIGGAGPYSGSDGADSAIAGSYICTIWGLRNFIGSSLAGYLFGNYGSMLSSENAAVSNGQNHVVVINSRNDSLTTVSTGSDQTIIHSSAHPGTLINYGGMTNNGAVTATSFSGSGAGLTGIPATALPSVPIMPRDDVVLYCPMRGATGATLANEIDSVQPTVVGSPAAASVVTDSSGRPSIGRCLTFDGVNDALNFGTGYNIGTGNLSISVWIKTEATFQSVVEKLEVVGANPAYIVRLNNNVVITEFSGITGGTGQLSIDIGTTFRDGKWHHLVVVFNRTAELTTAYLDSVMKGTTSLAAAVGSADNNGPLYIGCNWTGGGYFFSGQMDEFVMFTRALTAAEVQRLYLHGTIVMD